VVTSATGVVEEESDFYPFGGERIVANLISDQNYKFTGKERDFETNLDYFGARYYAFNFGRFITPDVPFIDQFEYDPQSWNLYSYARNNPLRNADPDGLVVVEYCQTGTDGEKVNCQRVSEEQHEKNVAEGTNQFEGGKIYDGDTVIGTYELLDEPPAAFVGFINLFVNGRPSGAKDLAFGLVELHPASLLADAATGDFEGMQAAMGIGGLSGVHAHHRLPQEFEDKFNDAGLDINSPEMKKALPADKHIGKGGVHPSGYNRRWRAFFDKHSKPTKRQILNYLRKLEKEFGI
jgi:RHS repeat-associated protein